MKTLHFWPCKVYNAAIMPAPRILIVRLSAVGDAIQTMPVACGAAGTVSRGVRGLGGRIPSRRVFRGHASVNELIELPRGSDEIAGEVWRLRRRLRQLRFDTAIDVQSLTKSAFVAWLSGARRRIGFGRPAGRELSRWLNNERVGPQATHVVDCYLELLRPLGIERPTVRFQVPEHEADRKTAEEIIGRLHWNAGFAIANPGAGWPSKSGPPIVMRPWPWPERSASTADAGDVGRSPGGTGVGRADCGFGRRRGPIGPPTTLPGLAVLSVRTPLYRLGYRPVAFGGGRRYAMRGFVRPWPAASTVPTARNISPCSKWFLMVRPAGVPPRRLHGEHYDRHGGGCVRAVLRPRPVVIFGFVFVARTFLCEFPRLERTS